MAMSGSARSTDIYNAVTGMNPNMSKLSSAEVTTLKAYYLAIWGTDTTYIQSNAQANPGSTLVAMLSTFLSAAPGSPVTGTGLLTGQGTIS